jgi:predicted  nucleic acid-binding Zn-ribbon protein
MRGMPNWEENEKGMLRCTQCGDLYPAAATNDGDWVLIGVADGSRCHECGSDEFEQVGFRPSA